MTFYFIFLILFYLTLQYCTGFAIYQQESAIDIHMSPPSHFPPHPTHPECHRALGQAPCAIQQIPFGYLFYIW